MSIEDILFTQQMMCPNCYRYIERENGLFYCSFCDKYYESKYAILHLGDKNINKIKLVEVEKN